MNGTNIFSFIRNFLLYLVVIGVMAAYPLYKLADSVIIEGVLANLGLFFFLTVGAYWLIMRSSHKKEFNILNAFLLSMILKMFVSLIYFLALLSNFKGREIDFALTFFGVYLICTFFEVYYLLRNLRQI